MNKGLTNTQVLINEYIRQEHADNPQYPTENDFFEFFVASQIVKEYDLSDEEIDSGICDAALDGGCDSIYLFVDNILINDSVPLDQFKRGVTVNLYIIQAKNTTSFKENAIQNWKTTCSNLLDMDKDFENLYSQGNTHGKIDK